MEDTSAEELIARFTGRVLDVEEQMCRLKQKIVRDEKEIIILKAKVEKMKSKKKQFEKKLGKSEARLRLMGVDFGLKFEILSELCALEFGSFRH